MRYFIAIIIINTFLFGCGNQLSVSGNWKNSTMELQLTPDNNFILSDSGATKLSGIYTIVFDKMQFINSGNNIAKQCMKPGRYSFTLVNDTLQLTMQDDPCTERKLTLNGTYWNRIR
jgi:hypothetical protein